MLLMRMNLACDWPDNNCCSGATIEADKLAGIIDSFDSINGNSTTDMTLASGATIDIASAEIAYAS